MNEPRRTVLNYFQQHSTVEQQNTTFCRKSVTRKPSDPDALYSTSKDEEEEDEEDEAEGDVEAAQALQQTMMEKQRHLM